MNWACAAAVRSASAGFKPFGERAGFQPQLEIAQPLDGGLGGLQAVERKVQRLAVRHRGQQIAHRFGRVAAAQYVAQREVIPQRLRHLLAFHHQELGVQPEAREWLSGERFRLRDFVLMMRKDQVDAARVDIQRLAQILNGHHGAFDVPAGPAAADLLVPENFALLGRFPQREIARVRLFVLVHVDARAGADAAEIVVRQLAIFRKRGDAEVDGAVARVSVAARREALDGLRHFVNVLGGRRDVLGRLQPQQARNRRERLVCSARYNRRAIWLRATALRMILSSTSVMFMTWSSRKPLARSHRRRISTNMNVRKLPMCA